MPQTTTTGTWELNPLGPPSRNASLLPQEKKPAQLSWTRATEGTHKQHTQIITHLLCCTFTTTVCCLCWSDPAISEYLAGCSVFQALQDKDMFLSGDLIVGGESCVSRRVTVQGQHPGGLAFSFSSFFLFYLTEQLFLLSYCYTPHPHPTPPRDA